MSKGRSLYSPRPGYKMDAAFERNLPERTGKSLEEWIDLIRREAPVNESQRRTWLRRKHGISLNYAWWIADRAEGNRGAEDYDPESLVESMFSGPKFALRPLYDRLLEIALALGPDVTASPSRTGVPLYRSHVFAQLKPSTRTRLDLGLALRDTPAEGRLIDTGGYVKKDRITHRIAITSLEQIDDHVTFRMRSAYELDV